MPDIKRYKITEPYLDLNCGLGEAPFWEKDRGTLRFVDIVKQKLYFLDPQAGPSSLRKLDLDFNIGTTADIEGNDEEFIFGGKRGYGIMNRETGGSRWLVEMWSAEEKKADGGGKPGVGKTRQERMRSNDGAVDAGGRYWVGTMNDPPVVEGKITNEGILFRLDPDLSLHRVKEAVTIPNGTSWTLDNRSMYFTESTSGTIQKYPYDPTTGAVDWDAGTTFFTCPYEGGVPDGHTQDEEGCFWIALFGTGKVVRVNTEGEIVAEIELPTRCVTCPGFVGTELFITSAEEQDPEKYAWSVKHQGGLFRVDVGVRGCPLNKFKMPAKA
ncbi:rRNA-processing protein cgr1 [Teratosphaeriaceae sp. CCFEE 6253]|nr:rRNA-processing protein cgr1 [Teratosphaeriaceae sp. CCFEE 6253]